MMSVFEEIKQSLSIKEAARYYGIQTNKAGFAKCPFHVERTPSMKIYEDHFYCFSCQCGGDVIHLVSQLFSLSPMDSVKKLQADFGLAEVEFDNKQYQIERQTKMQALLKEKQFESWKHNTFLLLTEYCALLRKWKSEYAPKDEQSELSEKFLESVMELEKTEYYCDLFLYGTKADLEDFRKNEERTMKRIEQRMRYGKQLEVGKTSPSL